MTEHLMTREDYEQRKEKLASLKQETLKIAEELKIARGFGDLSENEEYDAAKANQAKNAADIAKLEEELQNVKIIERASSFSDKIGIGSVVTIKNTATEAEMNVEIVGSMAADPSVGKISNESPIGGALLGHSVGDIVPVVTPAGTAHLQVIAIF